VTGNLGKILHAAGAIPSSNWNPDATVLPTSDKGMIETVDGTRIMTWPVLKDAVGGDGFELFLHDLPPTVCGRIAAFDYQSGSGVLGAGIAYVDFGMTFAGVTIRAASQRYDMASGPNSYLKGLTPSEAGTYCHNPPAWVIPGLVIGFFYDG
jgi:hypothetical protein